MRVVGTTADQAFLDREGHLALGIEPGNDPLHLFHHFGADAVAGEDEQGLRGHVRGSPVLKEIFTTKVTKGTKENTKKKFFVNPS